MNNLEEKNRKAFLDFIERLKKIDPKMHKFITISNTQGTLKIDYKERDFSIVSLTMERVWNYKYINREKVVWFCDDKIFWRTVEKSYETSLYDLIEYLKDTYVDISWGKKRELCCKMFTEFCRENDIRRPRGIDWSSLPYTPQM